METRKDLFLNALSNGGTTPTPTTQEEKILANLAGTGGLGIELPAVTASNNGQVLMVVNGKWTVASIPSQLPAVTADNNGAVLKVTNGAWAIGEDATE